MFERAVNYEPVKITKILYFSSAMVVDKVKRRSESLEDGLRFFILFDLQKTIRIKICFSSKVPN